MKINKIYLSAAAILLLAGCDDEWNEDKLDGFQEGAQVTDVKTVEYTLTDADYGKISGNKTNKSIAEAEGLADELKNLSKDKYFTENITAAKFLPAYLAATYPTADDKSAVKVTYTKYVGQPEYLSAFEGGTTYEVKAADYASVWEAKNVEAQFLTPKTLSKLSGILKAAKPEAKAGDVVIANYNYSQTEPSISIGGGDNNKVQVPGPWQNLTIPTLPTGNSWTWVNSGDIDLSAYAGKKIQLGFTYISDGTSQGTATYDVTNIKVSSKGAVVFEEGFTAGLGECTAEGELPEGLNFVWTAKDYKGTFYVRASAFANNNRYAVNSTLVTPVIDLKDAATLNYDHEMNYFKLGAEKIADFVKVSVREVIEMNSDQAKGPFYAKSNSIVEGTKYLFAANVDGTWKTGTPVAMDGKPYGYIKTVDMEGEVIAANDEVNALAFVFKKTAAGYSIQDLQNGRFYGSDLGHGSFQLSTKYLEPTEEKSFDWTITAQADGTLKITNVLSNRTIQFGTKYKNFSSEKELNGILPNLLQYNEAPVLSRAMPKVSYNASDVYTFDGTVWKEARQDGVDVQAIDPEIYNIIGKDYISNSSSILPEYMEKHNPYAQDGEKVALVYLAKDQEVRAKELVYTDGAWVITTHVAQVVDQFVRAGGVWNFDPSVTVDLLTKGALTDLYYQAATDWVWDNVDVPAGCTKKGQGYVSSYGNNDYYTGCSAHYDNVDWRASKAVTQHPKAYEGMSDDEIVAKMQEQFTAVMQEVLPQLHPDAKPVEGVEVLYTLNFIVYTGVNSNWTIAYKVTAPGTFEYVPESLKQIQ